MAYDDMQYRTLYRKLLSLYPSEFREQLSESMEQTFNDLCRERRDAGKGLLGFALWTFADTLLGIIREDIKNSMKLTVFKMVLFANIVALAILFGTWWANGKDDTWLYLTSAALVLSSFLYVKPPKKDKDQ